MLKFSPNSFPCHSDPVPDHEKDDTLGIQSPSTNELGFTQKPSESVKSEAVFVHQVIEGGFIVPSPTLFAAHTLFRSGLVGVLRGGSAMSGGVYKSFVILSTIQREFLVLFFETEGLLSSKDGYHRFSASALELSRYASRLVI